MSLHMYTCTKIKMRLSLQHAYRIQHAPYTARLHHILYEENLRIFSNMCTRSSNIFAPTLQRHNTENSKQIFPEKELSCLSPNFHIHVHVYLSDFHFIFPVCLFCYRKICGRILGIYKSLTDTWMWKLGMRPRNSFSGNP